ncbi:hypothetical protein GCM10027563_35180 [Parasphingorhabdus pacifica]
MAVVGAVVFGVTFALAAYFWRDRDLGQALWSGALTATVWCLVTLGLTWAMSGRDTTEDRTD